MNRPPRNPAELDLFLREAMEITIPQTPLAPGSTAPFAYLAHTFFEGRRFTQPAAPPAPIPHRPPDCVVWANRGGGKTFLAAAATLLDLLFKPGIEVRLLGGSLEQSARMHEHLARLAARPGVRALGRARISARRVAFADRGSAAEILAQSHTSVRGVRVQKLRCDEVELFDPDVWQAAQLTTRSLRRAGPWGPTVRGAVEALSTMHRPMGLMWRIVQDAIPPAPDATPDSPAHSPSRHARLLFRWGVLDALEHCPPARPCNTCPLEAPCAGRAKTRPPAHAGHITIDDALAARARTTTDTWESEMLCLRPSRSSAVVPEFDPAIHVAEGRADLPTAHDPAAPPTILIAGMDFGIRAPTVILWATVAPDGVVHVVDELVRAGRTMHDHVAELVARPRPAWIGIDPAGHQRSDQTGLSNAALLRRAGIVVRSRRAGVAEGIARLRRRLAPTPTLFVHPRCMRLIESLQRLHYPPDQPESLTPVKDGHDHAVDALRYLITNLDAPTTLRWRE